MRRRLNKKGQSTLEYLLITAGVVAALILFTQTVLRGKVDSSFTAAENKIGDAVSTTFSDMRLGNYTPSASTTDDGM